MLGKLRSFEVVDVALAGIEEAPEVNDGRDAFLVISSAYYYRTCLWSADIFTSFWQEIFLFL